MVEPREFDRFFKQATGESPYDYQRELGLADPPPAVVEVPTGSGKTAAALSSWLFARRVRRHGPRRLVYALPMRTLVEQTRDVAIGIRENLELGEAELPIRIVMGGEADTDWLGHPEQDQILIGTIDMLLSRALNRGYGESRFAWPISFGLLNADCRWVFDEVQLMGPARTTSAQLDGLRSSFGTALPCETIWMSATVDRDALRTVDRLELGEVMTLPARDRKGKLGKRLTATKTLRCEDLSGVKSTAVPQAIAELALQHHQADTRTLVVLNRVEMAQQVFAELLKRAEGDDPPRVVLLHSRFRPRDREAHMSQALADPVAAGTIVVATQVIEAGVDFSSRVLITETAPFSSMVQRLGRCNRAGEYPEADVVWLDHLGAVPDTEAGRKDAAPYLPEDLNSARSALEGLAGASLSPQALEGIEVPEVPDSPVILRRRDLIDLFDTSPDLSGLDVDVAPFIRDDDERSVLACFREIEASQPVETGWPEEDELVQIPLASIRRRRCWKADHVDGTWQRLFGSEVPPGSTVILDAAEGGYTPKLGWNGRSRDHVDPIALPAPSDPPEGFSSENQGTEPQELGEHLSRVEAAAKEITRQLGLDEHAEPIAAAAALHDLGKAHPVFQETLRTVMGIDGDQAADGRLWAKSGKRGGRHQRPYFRHELASALAIRALDGEVELPSRELTTYLVAAHHGRVRLSIRPAPDERQDAPPDAPFALGIIDGDSLPAVETPLGTVPETTLTLRCMELGAEDSWTNSVLALRDSPEFGPFRLTFLEAIVRIADWRGSA